MRKNVSTTKTGFTIAELLIVIVVIAILAAVSIVAYRGIQDRATATALQSDLRNASTQLGIVKATDGTYPTPSLPSEVKKSVGTDFQYSSDGSAYCLTATSNRSTTITYNISSTGSISQGACSGHGTSGQIAAIQPPTDCPAGFIPVPGNISLGTDGFCVMKYEAKNVGGIPASQATGTPWVSISQPAAMTASQNACSGCQLITEAQWMTIAANVMSVADNWTGGSIGSGTVYAGHSDNSPASPLAASSNDSDNYYGTGQTSGTQRRTLTLTNGEVIWDFSGNAWDRTQGVLTGTQPGRTGQSGYSWTAYNHVDLQWNDLGEISRPTGTVYAANVTGGIYSNPAAPTGSRAALRGGYYVIGGVLALGLDTTPASGLPNVSFRVTR